MKKGIVIAGVFTREKDLSFLPQGIVILVEKLDRP